MLNLWVLAFRGLQPRISSVNVQMAAVLLVFVIAPLGLTVAGSDDSVGRLSSGISSVTDIPLLGIVSQSIGQIGLAIEISC